MRIIHLQHGRRYSEDNEFTAINRDRVENNISLEFYLANCECGAQGLFLVEQANMQDDYFMPSPTQAFEQIDIDCPANCGGTIRLAFTDIHPQHGLKVRCLEAWTRRVEVQGLEDHSEDAPYFHEVAVEAKMETFPSPVAYKTEYYIRFGLDHIALAMRTPATIEKEMIYRATHLIHNLMVKQP